MASDMHIVGLENVTGTLLHLVTQVDKHKGPTFTVWPLGGRADGMKPKMEQAWVRV